MSKPFATPTPDAVLAEIDRFFYNVADRVAYLRDRWMDESEHEDFADYEGNLRAWARAADPKVKIIRVTRRPWGFSFTLPGAPEGAEYVIRATARDVSWTRLC